MILGEKPKCSVRISKCCSAEATCFLVVDEDEDDEAEAAAALVFVELLLLAFTILNSIFE